MGDAADQALERAEIEWDLYEKLRDSSLEDKIESGLWDEFGDLVGDPSSYPGRQKPKGLFDF